jgi:hypothetical protein
LKALPPLADDEEGCRDSHYFQGRKEKPEIEIAHFASCHTDSSVDLACFNF